MRVALPRVAFVVWNVAWAIAVIASYRWGWINGRKYERLGSSVSVDSAKEQQ